MAELNLSMNKIRSGFPRALFAIAMLFAVAVEASSLKPSEIRKFRGTYRGPVAGIAGQASGNPGAPIGPFEATVNYAPKRAELLRPLISNLHSQAAHRIVYRKPTGTKKRMVVVGTYNRAVSASLQIEGRRTMVFFDRGKGKKPRYRMRFNEELKEIELGSVASAHRVSGTLRK